MSDPGHHRLPKLLGPHLLLGDPLPENVVGVHAVLDRLEPGVVHLLRHVGLTDVDQHLHRPEEKSGRVGKILSSPARSRAVDSLKHRTAVPNVGGAGQPHGAGNLGRHVGQDVAVQIRHHDHVEHLGRVGQLRRADVHNPVLLLDIGIFGPDFVEYLVKEPVGHLHDVVLGEAGHLLAAIGPRVLKRVADDLLGAGAGDEL